MEREKIEAQPKDANIQRRLKSSPAPKMCTNSVMAGCPDFSGGKGSRDGWREMHTLAYDCCQRAAGRQNFWHTCKNRLSVASKTGTSNAETRTPNRKNNKTIDDDQQMTNQCNASTALEKRPGRSSIFQISAAWDHGSTFEGRCCTFSPCCCCVAVVLCCCTYRMSLAFRSLSLCRPTYTCHE